MPLKPDRHLPLHNIPIKSNLARQIRRGFRSESHVAHDLDFASIEQSILAFLRRHV